MNPADLFPLMDSCKTTDEHLDGLLEALEHSAHVISDDGLVRCISLCRSLRKQNANSQAKVNDAFHQLNIVNNAVTGE